MVHIGMGFDLYKEENWDRNSSSAHHRLGEIQYKQSQNHRPGRHSR